jgi:hypothetical protein
MKNVYNKKSSLTCFQTSAKMLAVFSFLMFLSYLSFANVYPVSSTTDGHAVNQLRGAIEAADAAGGGPHTITVPAGTYNLILGQIVFGNNAQNISIIGAGPSVTIINMTTTLQNRIFFINTTGTIAGVQTTINGIKFTNGHLTEAFGGGAILAGGPTNVLNLLNCVFENNTIDAVTGGTTGGAINMAGGGTLSIDHCTFSNNSNPVSDGGAVFYFLQNFAGLSGSVSITNSTFDNNIVSAPSGSGGGAIAITTQGTLGGGSTFSATISNNTFINNKSTGVAGYAGAIKINNGFAVGNTVQVHYNRIVNNTSTVSPNGLALNSAAGSVDATDNWWGCNTGPGVAGSCNQAAIVGSGGVGQLNINTWMQLKAMASPTPICPTNVLLGNTSTVTASFLKNSAGTSLSVSNIDRLIGLHISFTSLLGTLSEAQTGIQANGTATVLFTSNGTPGDGSVNAMVDNVPNNDATAKASIFINTPASITGQPENSTVCTGSTVTFTVTAAGVPAPTFQWRKGTTSLTNGATGSGSIISNATTATLTISNASAADVAANYNVVVTNSCASVFSNNASLAVLLPPVVNAPTVTQPTCAVPTGTIVINATGGATLEYSNDGVNWQSSNEFSGLSAPGNYNISVRYQGISGCVTAYSANPVVIGAVPLAPSVNAPTVTQPTCAVTSGTIVVNATGSSALEYSKDGGSNWQTSNTFSELAPGSYTISARLQNNTTCVTSYSSNPVTINAIPTPPEIDAPTVTQPTCALPTGTIVVNATGGSTMEYSKDGGVNWQLSNSFSGLASGNYNISARLQNNITCTNDYSTNPVVINGVPSAPVVNTLTVTQPTCALLLGTIVVNATGSATMEYSKDGTNWQSSNEFSGLAPGNYDISVRFENNPTCVNSYSLNPVAINAAPAPPVVNAPTVTQPTCDLSTGTIVVNASGIGALEYSKDGGTNWQASNSFGGLAPGNYNISARLQGNTSCESSYIGNPVIITAATGCTVVPEITCPANVTVTLATGECTQSVSFAATATGVPAPTIVYKIGSSVITSPHNFPVGPTTVISTATNIAGTDNCSFTVTVIDNQPPVINTIANPIELLWPPNHKTQTIKVADFVTSVTDNCGSIQIKNVVIIKVTSDELEDAPGNDDGRTTKDIVIASNCKSVTLRKERMDGGNGRVYLIYVAVTDLKGNTGTAIAKVSVRSDQSGATAVNDGEVYAVMSNCSIASESASSPIITESSEIKGLMLMQNYPNPTNSITTVRYELPFDARIKLVLYNNLGQKVAQLAEGWMSAGLHQARFDASKLAAGIYLYHLQGVDASGKPFVLNKKMIVAK